MHTAQINQGPFHDTSLTSITLGREISYCNDDEDGLVDFVPTATDQGLFSFQYDAESLSVALSNNVQTISNYMFTGTNIQSLTIPGSVTTIGNYAFYQCYKLDSIRFEGSATPLTIGFQPISIQEMGPFYQSPLTSIYVNRELVASQEYAAARDQADEGIFSTKSNSRNVTVTLQGNVKTISDYMFSGVNMQTIWIPREVTSIGYRAFYNCSQLYGVTLAHTADPLPPTLGEKAFEGTLIDDPDVKNRWIALEYGYEEKVLLKFKSAPYWSKYAAIIQPQKKN
jgi:archaellum component FlaG (FlaF/FlaG flagellin family)